MNNHFQTEQFVLRCKAAFTVTKPIAFFGVFINSNRAEIGDICTRGGQLLLFMEVSLSF